MPLLSYQQLLYQQLQQRKCIWIKKSRGLGVTTFFLYWLAYCCFAKFKPGDRACIVVGPRIDSAKDLIARFKGLFARNFPTIYSELTKQGSTYAILNGVKVEAFPSHHVDSMRGFDNVKFIMSDESDFYPPFQQKEVRAVIEGYLGKPNSSDLTIVLVSTPNAPNGLFQQIEQEPIDKTLYYKFFFDYRYGLEGPNPIYSQSQIELARKSPDFGREFELAYLGVLGNVFSPQSIENCQKIEYNPQQVVPNCRVSLGCDPSFGSSKFAIVATRFVDGKIQVVIAEEWDRPDFQSMLDRIWEIKQEIGLSACYVDAANPEIWTGLKRMFNEPYSESYMSDKMSWYRKNNLDPANHMRIIPTPFNPEGKKMLQHCKSLLEDSKQLVLIDKRFDKLLTSLRTAVAEEYKLKKEDTSYNDILDAFMLSLQYYKRSR